MERLVRIEARHPHRLYAEFSDGVKGEVDMADKLVGPVMAPLRDPSFFARVELAEWGAPVWPNGVDVAPDALHARLVAAQTGARAR